MQIQANRRIPMPSTRNARIRQTVAGFVLLAASTCFTMGQSNRFRPISSPGSNDAFLPSPVRSASTVPSNGDVNPYGVAFIKNNFLTGSGPLQHGDVLVSNFNNKQNLQGTGTTIVRIPQSGAPTVFFQGTAPLGLNGSGHTAVRLRAGGQFAYEGWNIRNRGTWFSVGDQQPGEIDPDFHQQSD
jgi:hypothetical protein